MVAIKRVDCMKNQIHAMSPVDCRLHIFFWFGSYVPVDSYGHVGTVSSPNHTFFLGKLH